MTSRTPVLEVDGLNVWFTAGRGRKDAVERHTLKDVSFELAAGERLGLVGESGSGKTTTILATLGLLPSSASVSGSVRLGGEDILRGGDRTIRPHRWTDIAMVFQGAMNAFNPVRTIGSQIAEAIGAHTTLTRASIEARVRELLDLVDIPPDRGRQYPHQFSGGMRQRAMIAMALACEPRVLLADEPTTALDVVVQDQVLQLLVRLSEELGLALVLVTHDLGVVARACHRAAVMVDGRIVEQNTVENLYHHGTEAYTRELFAATPSLSALAQTSELSRASAGAPHTLADTKRPLLDVSEVSISFDTPARRRDRTPRGGPARKAVDGVSITVDRGELVALVGQSGCGKTTTLMGILGMQRIDDGRITVDGRDVATLARRDTMAFRRSVQMIYQDPYESLDARFRVRDTLLEPLQIHGLGGTARERERLVHDALVRVGLTPPETYLDRYPHELSGGQRQRVAIAASLVIGPELLLADEPVSMLDVTVRAGVLDLLAELRSRERMGILMITHDLSTAATHADRIVVMHEGRVVEEGPSTRIVTEPRHPYTRRLLESVPDPDPCSAVVADRVSGTDRRAG